MDICPPSFRRFALAAIAAVSGCALSVTASAQSVSEFANRDSGRVRTFELAPQELMVTHKGPGVRAAGAELEAAIPGAQVLEQKNSRALVRMPAAVNRRRAALRLDEASQALPSAEVAPVLYEKGQPRGVQSRRIVTRQILAKQPPGWSAEQVLAAAGALKVEATAVPDHVMLTMPTPFSALDVIGTLRSRGVEATLQLQRQQEKRFTPNDPFFLSQWHLRNSGQTNGVVGMDANVVRALDFTKGAGVTVSIVDDSLQTAHPDLQPNCPPISSNKHHDFNDDDNNPAPDPFDRHGTAVGGVTAAKGNNNLGVSGAAPDAELIGIRLISGPVSDAEEASALYWRPAGVTVGVSNNSWGPFDGSGIHGPDLLTKQALQDAATFGRGGRGQVTVFAAGNGRQRNDDANLDGYGNSRFVLAVAASTNQGQQSFYSEPGANILVCAPSNGGTLGVVTTDVTGNGGYNPGPGEPTDQNYTNSFGGTSSAAPLTAGGVALLLAANPNLGWRDVHEIMATTARQIQPADTDWVTNGAGFKFNHKFGGGMIDVTAALARALDWQSLGAEISQSRVLASPNVPAAIPDNSTVGITRTFDFATGANLRVEHVELIADIQHPQRSDLEIVVIAPSGKRSVMVPNRPRPPSSSGDNNIDYTDGSVGWSFTSTHHWGENSMGAWTLTVRDRLSGTTGTLRNATLKLFGTNSPSQQRVRFESQTVSVGESASSASVRVQRLGDRQGPASIDYVTSTVSTATAGQDFASASGTLAFEDGQEFATVTVPLLPDAVPESRETIYVLLRNPVGTVFGGVTVAQIDIVDDDGNFIFVKASDEEAKEHTAPQPANPGRFTIERAAADALPVTVRYTVSGKALSGSDYIAIASQATIPAFEKSVDVAVQPLDDSASEAAESVVLTLEDGGLAYTVGVPDSAVVNIVDNDLQKVSITAPINNVSEAGSPVSFRVERNGVYPEPLTVQLTIGGTARPGIHYEILPERVEIAGGASFVEVPLIPIDDDVFTPNKFVEIELAASNDYVPDFRRNARINIADNEPLPDTNRPSVRITAPQNGTRIFAGSPVTASGTASDNDEVKRVSYRLNGGGEKIATGTTNWTADLTPDVIAGLNTLQVRAIDDVNNGSPTESRTFTFVRTHTLTVTAGPGGSVSGAEPATREAGQRYTVTAAPQPGFVFNGWSGPDLSSNSRSFTFVMPDNDTSLTADFVQNPFTSEVTGSYAGLVQAETFAFGSSGLLQLRLGSGGAFSGTVIYAGARYSFQGEFTGSGRYIGLAKRKKGKVPLTLDLTLDLGGTQQITGTVSSTNFTSAVVAGRAAFNRDIAPYPAVAKYTLLLPPLEAPTTQQPHGNGHGSLTIDASGVVRWRVTLSDSTAASGSASLTKERHWPLFINLYKGKGVLLGSVSLDEQQAESDLSAAVDWSRPSNRKSKLFRLGFVVEDAALLGSVYTAPSDGERVLSGFDSAPGNAGTVAFLEGNLKQSASDKQFTEPVTLSPRNKVTFTGPNRNKAALTIDSASGGLAGSFIHPLTKKKTTFKGVVFEKQQLGAGTFVGSVIGGTTSPQTGTVTLTPNEPAP